MKVLSSIAELETVPGPLFLAIGVFDGVHLGHRAVIERACADADAAGGTPVVVTFHPHPLRVLRPAAAPRLLTSTPHKIQLIRALGVQHLLIVPFDAAFANTEPAHFIEQLVEASRPLREICVGGTWSFGKGRAGNLDLLSRLGARLGFVEVGVDVVTVGSAVVSSTLIRSAVESGDFARAEEMLGRPYTILGTVQHGDAIGRTLGFPTANMAAHNEQFPPNGVYSVSARLADRSLRGVANIGVRPTIQNASGERIFEVHLLDFAEDIYGRELEITFRRFIRGEQRFGSMEELKRQIVRDTLDARSI